MNPYNGVRRRRRAVVMVAVVTLVSAMTTTFASAAMVGESGVLPTTGDQLADGVGGAAGPCVPVARMAPPQLDARADVHRALADQCSADAGDPEDEGEDQDLKSQWREKHKKYQQEYGDIGCTRVPGFSDRCPDLVSIPVKPTAGAAGVMAAYANNVYPTTMVASPDDEFLFGIGGERAPGRMSPVIAKFGRSGDLLWTRTFGTELLGVEGAPGNQQFAEMTPTRAAVSDDGDRVFVMGYLRGEATRLPVVGVLSDSWVASLDAHSGDVQWLHRLTGLINRPGARQVSPGRMAVGHDGERLFLTASVGYGGSPQDCEADGEAWHLALNTTSGELTWASGYSEHRATGVGINGEPLAVSPDGSRLLSQVIVGDPCTNMTIGVATHAYDPLTGDLLWERIFWHSEGSGTQNPPGGLVVSPDGETVYAATAHQYDGDDGGRVGEFRVFAYGTTDGRSLWARTYSGAEGSGCSENLVHLHSLERNLVMSPSGKLLYLAGPAGYDAASAGGPAGVGGCHSNDFWSGTVVLAIRADSGDVKWRSFFGNGGLSCDHWGRLCDISIAPGPLGGDEGSRILVTSFSWSGVDFAPIYTMVLAFRGSNGKHLWQARYLDTYNDGGTLIQPAASQVTADGRRLHVLNLEISRTRDWPYSMQLIGYDVRHPGERP